VTAYHRSVRWGLAWASVVLGACGPAPDAWRECDEAFAQLPTPTAPTEYASIVPVGIGDALPTIRVEAHPIGAESLANRALATACVLTDDAVSATPELVTWGQDVLNGELFPEVGEVFDPPLSLDSMRTGTVALDIDVSRAAVGAVDASTGSLGEDIGDSAALIVAEGVLNDLVERGLLADTELLLLAQSRLITGVCDAATNECEDHVLSYSFVFEPRIAGVAVRGSWAVIDVQRDGTPIGLRIATVDIAAAGSTIAAIDEERAEVRFLELAQAEYPAHEVWIDTPGRVAFVVPGAATQVEPVWYGVWNTRSESGVTGRPQGSWLSLTDPNAPLVDAGP
jgi:hypothetical protein